MPLFTRDQLYCRGRPSVKAIFSETPPHTGPLTYSREDKTGKLSLYKLYMIYFEDPSEVGFAEEVFGDIHFWKALTESTSFKYELEEWRWEASEKRKHMAFKAIVQEAKGGKSAFTAAKFLIDEPWIKGRTLQERKKISKRQEEASSKAYQTISVSEDFKRLKEQGIL